MNAPSQPGARDTNGWDAVIAFIVVGALVALVIYLVANYGGDTEKVTSVLGVAAPVLAAAFGITLGYYSGQKMGQATGRDQAKAQMKAAIGSRLDDLEAGIGQPVGEDSVRDAAGTALHQIRGLIDSP